MVWRTTSGSSPTPQGSYILSVFTEGIDDGETANQTIAAVAEAVHAVWGPKQGVEAASALGCADRRSFTPRCRRDASCHC